MRDEIIRRVFFDIPGLLQCKDIKAKYDRICMIFDMKYGIPAQKVRQIMFGFPYLPLIDDDKL